MDVVASFILPTLNEEHNLGRCLGSIRKQTFDHRRIEVVIADAGSTDATLDTARSWQESSGIQTVILTNERRVAEYGKAIAIAASSGAYLVLLDADNEIVQNDWLETALAAFDVFPEVYAFESHYLKAPDAHPVSNFLTACLHISDPLAWAIAARPPLLATIRREQVLYEKYGLLPGYPCGANGFIYRRQSISHLLGQDTFEEADLNDRLAQNVDMAYAMAVGYGVRHHYITSLCQFLRKCMKIAVKHLTRAREHSTWVEARRRRLYVASLLHVTIIYPLLYSVCRAVVDREPLWLYHAPLAFITSVVNGVAWLRVRVLRHRAW